MMNLKKSFNDCLAFASNKICILRLDLNLPIVDGQFSDFTRLEKVLPTLNSLIEENGKIIIVSHAGRPKGFDNKNLSLKPLQNIFEKKLDTKVYFCNEDIFDRKIERFIKKLKPKEVCILENIRFYHQEEQNDQTFAKRIASFGDIYINDSFSVSHREHASISGIGKFLPCFPGKLLEEEVKNMSKIFASLQANATAILGGSKISTKIGLIENLTKKFEKILIGGAMSNTLIQSLGYEIGKSLTENSYLKQSKEIMTNFKNKIVIPDDVICVSSLDSDDGITRDIKSISKNDIIVDIGPKTRKRFYNEVINSEIILWNGPLGIFEKKPFDNGTNYVASAIKFKNKKKFFSVAGGGDTISALKNSDFYDEFSYVSTGGGAFLEFIEGKKLPGIEILNN